MTAAWDCPCGHVNYGRKVCFGCGVTRGGTATPATPTPTPTRARRRGRETSKREREKPARKPITQQTVIMVALVVIAGALVWPYVRRAASSTIEVVGEVVPGVGPWSAEEYVAVQERYRKKYQDRRVWITDLDERLRKACYGTGSSYDTNVGYHAHNYADNEMVRRGLDRELRSLRGEILTASFWSVSLDRRTRGTERADRYVAEFEARKVRYLALMQVQIRIGSDARKAGRTTSGVYGDAVREYGRRKRAGLVK
jgi:hypothetical protein